MIRMEFENTLNENIKEFAKITPRSGLLEVTNRCNKTCNFCYASFNRKGQKFINEEFLNETFDYFEANGIRHITFSGGEPTMHGKLIRFIDLSIQRNFIPSVITNGSLINEDLAQAFLDREVKLKVSFEMNGDQHLSIKKMLELNKIGFKKENVIAALTIYAQEPNVVLSTLDEIYNENVCSVETNFVQLKGRAKFDKVTEENRNFIANRIIDRIIYKAYKLDGQYTQQIVNNYFIFSSLKCFNCSIGQDIKVDIDGNVFPCPLFINKENIIDNVTNKTLIKNSEKLKIKTKELFFQHRKPGCVDCKWTYHCGGGCLASKEGAVENSDCSLILQQYEYLNKIFKLYESKEGEMKL